MGRLLRQAAGGWQGSADSGGTVMTRWDRSDDPIPEGHVRRSELFEAYYRMVTPNWEDLEKAIEAAHRRRGSATNAPKRSASKPAADGPLSKTEEDKFLGTLSKTEKAFWKAEKTFYAAAKAKNDARDDAARKFIAALGAGELQPMIRKHGSNQVLSPNIWDRDILWDKDDVVPLLGDSTASSAVTAVLGPSFLRLVTLRVGSRSRQPLLLHRRWWDQTAAGRLRW